MKTPLVDAKSMSQYDFLAFRDPLRHILAAQTDQKRQIFLMGSSMGGNILMNLMGEDEFDQNEQIIAVSLF